MGNSGKQKINTVELNRVKNMFHYFKNNFVEKKITYTYYDKDDILSSIDIIMQKYNFLHLTGLIYEGRKPLSFYEDIEKNKVNPDLIYHPKNGFSKLKIATSDDIQFLKSDKVSICDGKSFVHLKFDKSIQNKKVSLSLKKSANHFIPLSLLNLADEKKSKALTPTYPVVKLEEYDFKTKEHSIVFNKLSGNYSNEVEKLIDAINILSGDIVIVKKGNEFDITD